MIVGDNGAVLYFDPCHSVNADDSSELAVKSKCEYNYGIISNVEVATQTYGRWVTSPPTLLSIHAPLHNSLCVL